MAGAVAVGFGLLVERFDINLLVGWAFAIAASTFCPLLVLGIWWRGLTAAGASAGLAVGRRPASAAILATMLADPTRVGRGAARPAGRLDGPGGLPHHGRRLPPHRPPGPGRGGAAYGPHAHPGSPRAGPELSRLASRAMGLWQRFSLFFKAKANTAIDKMEDPRETLDYSYQRQTELLQKVKRGLLDVATSRKRLEMQGEQLQAKATKLHEQAKKAMELGKEDLAREALTRRAAIEPELESLRAQHAGSSRRRRRS